MNSVPDLELLKDLPEFLDGLFVMLNDKKKEIRREADNTLSEFLKEIRESPSKSMVRSLHSILELELETQSNKLYVSMYI